MKLTNLFKLVMLGSTLTLATVGCRHHPVEPTTPLPGSAIPVKGVQPLPPEQPFNSGNPITSAPVSLPGEPGSIPMGDGHPGWTHDPAPLEAQSIYFEYDKSSVRSKEQSKLEAVFAYLKSNPDSALEVDGNCDERGTEEYNRSLGERRALAAREYLVHLGVESSRIDTISYGKDKPRATGHDEAAFQQNRRDDFVVLTRPKP